MSYINNGMVEWFSFALRDHQRTHFGDDVDGMKWSYYFIVEYDDYNYYWNNLLCN